MRRDEEREGMKKDVEREEMGRGRGGETRRENR